MAARFRKNTLFFELFLTCAAFISAENTSALLRGGFLERQLQGEAVPETCGYNMKWDWADDGYRHPIVPCTTHSACADFTDVGRGWQACCIIKDCVCGSTQVEFTPGILHCGRFACKSNAECGAGRCIAGKCDFQNIQANCKNASECGQSEVCVNGICAYKSSNGFVHLHSHGTHHSRSRHSSHG